METQAQSPFFPVPVRWFELPMNTARWGFARLQETTEYGSDSPHSETESDSGEPTGSSPAAEVSESSAAYDRPAVGRLLNERA